MDGIADSLFSFWNGNSNWVGNRDLNATTIPFGDREEIGTTILGPVGPRVSHLLEGGKTGRLEVEGGGGRGEGGGVYAKSIRKVCHSSSFSCYTMKNRRAVQIAYSSLVIRRQGHRGLSAPACSVLRGLTLEGLEGKTLECERQFFEHCGIPNRGCALQSARSMSLRPAPPLVYF
jgi:hypothetical protein